MALRQCDNFVSHRECLTVAVPFRTYIHSSTKAHPAKAGAAKPRVLAALRDTTHSRHEGP